MSQAITGATRVAGVVGAPVGHSLSPLIHNAWLAAAGIDGVYVAFAPPEAGFEAFIEGLRGGVIAGLNVTLPFKERALVLADHPTTRAQAAGAANLLAFEPGGAIFADNTDGVGLLGAFADQAPGFNPAKGPVVILGAGGAARGAAAAFLGAGAPVRIVNRTRARAQVLADALDGDITVYETGRISEALVDANALVNATSAAFSGADGLLVPLEGVTGLTVMDMTYIPLETPLLAQAKAAGLTVVDGLEMLIGQARPSFEAFFGRPPPEQMDVRALVLAELERRR